MIKLTPFSKYEPRINWILEPMFAPSSAVSFDTKVHVDSAQNSYFNYSVVQFSVILKKDSTALLIRKADSRKIVKAGDVVDGRISLEDAKYYTERTIVSLMDSNSYTGSTSAEYLLQSPDVSRSNYHITKVEQMEIDIRVGISTRPQELNSYKALIQDTSYGKALGQILDWWKKDITEDLRERCDDIEIIVEKEFGVPKNITKQKLVNPFVWIY